MSMIEDTSAFNGIAPTIVDKNSLRSYDAPKEVTLNNFPKAKIKVKEINIEVNKDPGFIDQMIAGGAICEKIYSDYFETYEFLFNENEPSGLIRGNGEILKFMGKVEEERYVPSLEDFIARYTKEWNWKIDNGLVEYMINGQNQIHKAAWELMELEPAPAKTKFPEEYNFKEYTPEFAAGFFRKVKDYTFHPEYELSGNILTMKIEKETVTKVIGWTKIALGTGDVFGFYIYPRYRKGNYSTIMHLIKRWTHCVGLNYLSMSTKDIGMAHGLFKNGFVPVGSEMHLGIFNNLVYENERRYIWIRDANFEKINNDFGIGVNEIIFGLKQFSSKEDIYYQAIMSNFVKDLRLYTEFRTLMKRFRNSEYTSYIDYELYQDEKNPVTKALVVVKQFVEEFKELSKQPIVPMLESFKPETITNLLKYFVYQKFMPKEMDKILRAFKEDTKIINTIKYVGEHTVGTDSYQNSSTYRTFRYQKKAKLNSGLYTPKCAIFKFHTVGDTHYYAIPIEGYIGSGLKPISCYSMTKIEKGKHKFEHDLETGRKKEFYEFTNLVPEVPHHTPFDNDQQLKYHSEKVIEKIAAFEEHQDPDETDFIMTDNKDSFLCFGRDIAQLEFNLILKRVANGAPLDAQIFRAYEIACNGSEFDFNRTKYKDIELYARQVKKIELITFSGSLNFKIVYHDDRNVLVKCDKDITWTTPFGDKQNFEIFLGFLFFYPYR